MRLPLVTRGEALPSLAPCWGRGGWHWGLLLRTDQDLAIWESGQRTIQASQTPCDQACWGDLEDGSQSRGP